MAKPRSGQGTISKVLPDRKTRMQTRPMRAETMSAVEAARRLGIGKSSLYEALARGEVPGIRIGGRWVVPRARFERFINGEEPGTAA
jgi:excisionase family DNA binding protein